LNKIGGEIRVDWWIGHDVVSGEAAIEGRSLFKESRTALIMHMNYADYQSFKHGVGQSAADKERRQRQLFKSADALFAVGPLLRDALTDLAGKQPIMLVPGFADIKPQPPQHRLTAITFGRMDRESERIKQGSLAVAGFAAACREAGTRAGTPTKLRENPQLRVIGIDAPGSDEERDIRQLAQVKSGRVINIIPQPFDSNRQHLFDQIGRANIALMLSWHEGFGLTGWEAIAGEVPLIVSRQSGLFRLVHETLKNPGIACLTPIDVQGRDGNNESEYYTEADEKAVRDAILRLAADLEGAHEAARHLKQMLREKLGCEWKNTARQLLEGLGENISEVINSTNRPAEVGHTLPKREAAERAQPTPLASSLIARPTGTRIGMTGTDLGGRVKVFLSYAPQDEPLQKEFDEHLGAVKREGLVEVWSDRQILPGSERNAEIAQRLEEADLILLLISPAFLNSIYCYEKEMRSAIEQHEAGAARVVPIILRHCHWELTPFAKLQGLPFGMRPVASWTTRGRRDAVWTEVAKAIYRVAKECASHRAATSATTSSETSSDVNKAPFSGGQNQNENLNRPKSGNFRGAKLRHDSSKTKTDTPPKWNVVGFADSNPGNGQSGKIDTLSEIIEYTRKTREGARWDNFDKEHYLWDLELDEQGNVICTSRISHSPK
jgi:hypothetical protein